MPLTLLLHAVAPPPHPPAGRHTQQAVKHSDCDVRVLMASLVGTSWQCLLGSKSGIEVNCKELGILPLECDLDRHPQSGGNVAVQTQCSAF